MPRLERGTTLHDRFAVEDFIATNAFAEVYRARDLADNRLIVLKAIHAQLMEEAGVVSRLRVEIEASAQLDQKNIALTYGVYQTTIEGAPLYYVVAEHIDGQSLRTMIDRNQAAGRPFSLKSAYNIVAHLCNALIYAHGLTAHGAIEPGSVWVNAAGRVKLADFGFGRALSPLASALTPSAQAARAPELVAGEHMDVRVDIYSVGAILFELLVGRPVVGGHEKPSQLVPGLSPLVDMVIETCLRSDPNERYPDAQVLKDAVQSALAGDLSQPMKNVASGSIPIVIPPSAAATAAAAAAIASNEAAAQPARPLPPKAPPPPPRAPSPPHRANAPSNAGAAPRRNATISDRVDAAISGFDGDAERWLIQKDKLDFGPYSLKDVQTQIEQGKILGEHMITDTETNDRRKVKEHPQLRQVLSHAETRLAAEARVAADAAEHRKHKAKVVSLLLTLIVVAVGGVGALSWYVMHRKPTVERIVVKEPAGDADFLKGVEITWKQEPAPPKTKVASTGGKKPGTTGGRNKGSEFDAPTTMGDATQDGGDEQLDAAVVQKVMNQNFRVLVGCITEERRRNASLHNIDMDFLIRGSGSVSAVKVNGQSNTLFAGCVFGKMQSVAFPKFNGARTHAAFSLAVK